MNNMCTVTDLSIPSSAHLLTTRPLPAGNCPPLHTHVLNLLSIVRAIGTSRKECWRIIDCDVPDFPAFWLPLPQVVWILMRVFHLAAQLQWVKDMRTHSITPLLQRKLGRRYDEGLYVEEGRIPDAPWYSFVATREYTRLTDHSNGSRFVVTERLEDQTFLREEIAAVRLKGEKRYSVFATPESAHKAIDLCVQSRALIGVAQDAVRLNPFFAGFEQDFIRFTAQYGSNPHSAAGVALAIGDFPLVNDVRRTEETQRLAAECVAKWQRELRSEVYHGLTVRLVHALADAGILTPYLLNALSDPMTMDAALSRVRNDNKWCEVVWPIVQSSEVFHWTAAEYLLSHGFKTEEVLLSAANRPAVYHRAIQLACKYAPKYLPAVLRNGIRHNLRETREIAAGILSLVDCNWARDILRDVLNDHAEWEFTEQARYALSRRKDPALRSLVRNWEYKHCESPLAGTPNRLWFRRVKARWADTVGRVRDRLPE